MCATFPVRTCAAGSGAAIAVWCRSPASRSPEARGWVCNGSRRVRRRPAGNDLVCSAWDILSGDVKPDVDVLIIDDAGDHAALQAADLIAASFSPEVMAMNLVPYMRNLQRSDVTFTVTWRLVSVEREGNQLRATLGSDYGDVTRQRLVD